MGGGSSENFFIVGGPIIGGSSGGPWAVGRAKNFFVGGAWVVGRVVVVVVMMVGRVVVVVVMMVGRVVVVVMMVGRVVVVVVMMVGRVVVVVVMMVGRVLVVVMMVERNFFSSTDQTHCRWCIVGGGDEPTSEDFCSERYVGKISPNIMYISNTLSFLGPNFHECAAFSRIMEVI